jgi:chemotaxis protein CheX
MKPILLSDCSEEVGRLMASLLGEKTLLQSGSFEHKRLEEFRMVVLETHREQRKVLDQIGRIRYACNFRNTPIIVVRGRDDHFPVQYYIMAGATEVLSIADPPAACRQILQGYLAPDRKPLEEEMKYLSPFIDHTILILKTMAGGRAEFREMYFANSIRVFGDISGVIGLSGEAEGTVVLTFYRDLAWKIISRMMQVKEDAVNADLIHDGVGELINMIGGSSKKSFVGTPYHFELSLPTVVVGSGHQIGHPENASIAILIFEMESSSFALHVCINPVRSAR